jgi:RimJ/RimL family protein N-acetyltransferase
MAWSAPDPSLTFEDEAVRLSPTDLARDGAGLWQAASLQSNGEDLFVYHPACGPYSSPEPFWADVAKRVTATGGLTYTVFSKRLHEVVGGLSLLNVRADHGTVEVGSVWYAKKAQRTEVNTHSVYLLMHYVFETLGFRRFEWKCNSLNQASQTAAVRLGFQLEGTFRQHFWDKGANRDTVWFSIIDGEWPSVKQRFETRLLAGR